MRSALYIGDNHVDEQCVLLGENLRNAHMHIIGCSDTGKTSHLLHMIQEDIVNGYGLCIIDLLGNLYPRILKFLAYYDLADRVVLFDPNDDDHCSGLNYFDTFGGTFEAATVCENAMDGIMRVYRQQDDSVRPRWETYAPLTFMPLIEQNLTMLEIMPFVSPHTDTFRAAVLPKHPEFHIAQGWREFDSKKSTTQKFELIEVVYNRGMRFWHNKRVRRIVGQQRNFVNWREAMDEGKIVLCNLGGTEKVTDSQRQMLGVIMLHQIINAAKTRRGDDLRRFYLYVDEFPQILCRDFETAPDTLRNFGISLILAHQRLDQLTKELQDIDVGSALMSNARVKEVFNISQKDAEPMTKEIFGPYIHGEDIKYQGTRTLLIPRQELVTLKGRTRSDVAGSFSGDPCYSYSEGVLFDDTLGSTTRYSTGTSRYGPSGGVQDAVTDSEGERDALQTVYDREEEQETPVFHSIEEKTWEYMRQILKQKQRESVLLIPGRKPISITTPWLNEYYVEDEHVANFVEAVHSRCGTLSAAKVDELIERRYRELLGGDFDRYWGTVDNSPDDPGIESDDERWQ